jgi:hypothetical protein
MRSAFRLLKTSTSDRSMSMMFPPAFREWADFSLLPDFDPLAKYFYFSVCGSSATADGLTLKIFSPRSPLLK